MTESSGKGETYELPDGNVITVGGKRCGCLGELFQPSTVDKEAGGIYGTTLQAIMNCDVDLRIDLYANVNLDDGMTSFPTSTTMRPASVNTTEELTALAPSK